MKHFIDNSIAPIIAIDFDGTICTGNSYPDPHNGELKLFAREIMNFLYDVGVKVVIWTNRKNIPDTDVKDKLLMKQWLSDMGIKYHTVNDSTEFAPFKYYGRKLYAHMFVDDRGFGFDYNECFIMLRVLYEFLVNIVGCNDRITQNVCDCILFNTDFDTNDVEHVKNRIQNWNKGDKTND